MYESSCRFQSEFGTMARICGVDRSKSGTSSRFAPAWTKKVTAVLAFSWTARMSFRSTSARPPRVTLHAAAAATMLAASSGENPICSIKNVCALSGGFVFGTAAALRSLATRFITTCGKISSLQPSPRRSRTMTSSVSAGFSSPGASAFPRGSTQGATARRRPSPVSSRGVGNVAVGRELATSFIRPAGRLGSTIDSPRPDGPGASSSPSPSSSRAATARAMHRRCRPTATLPRGRLHATPVA
eukprot:30918-Pelagococcus_subviridis.AAC.79